VKKIGPSSDRRRVGATVKHQSKNFQHAPRLSFDQIVARAKGVKVNGPWARFCCPIHRDQNPSAWARRFADGSGVCGCFAGCEQDQIVEALLSLPIRRQFQSSPKDSTSDVERRIASAQWIWSGAQELAGTLGVVYLDSRQILIHPLPPTLRFSWRCYHSSTKSYMPALIARIDDVRGVFTGVLRIYLAIDGSKAAVEPNKARRHALGSRAQNVFQSDEHL
jgi:hypothetical protein